MCYIKHKNRAKVQLFVDICKILYDKNEKCYVNIANLLFLLKIGQFLRDYAGN